MNSRPERIAAWKVVVASAYFVLERRATFARALLAPAAAMLVLEGVHLLATPGGAVQLVATLLHYAVYTVFAVTTHRVVLKGPGAMSGLPPMRWGSREWAYLGNAVLIGLVSGVPAAILGVAVVMITGTPMFAGVALLWTVVALARLSIVFPSIAVDAPLGLRGAWQLAGPYLWPLAAVTVLYPLLLSVPAMLFARLPFGGFPASLIGLVATALAVAALSFAYREVIRGAGPGGGTARIHRGVSR